MTTSVNLSMRTVITTLVYLAALWFLYVVRDVVAIVVMAIVLSAALNPTVSRLSKRGIPRGLAIAVLYIVIVGILAIIVVTFAPVVGQQFVQLFNSLPEIVQKILNLTHQIVPSLSGSSSGGNISSLITHFGTNLFHGVRSVVSGIVSLVAVLVLTFYFTLDEGGIRQAALSMTPKRWRQPVQAIVERIEQRLGSWLRGQLLLGLIIGVLAGTGLFFLKVEYAFALGLIAGLTELIPTIGPYIGMTPAVLIAYSQHPTLALYVAIMYYVIQQLENNFLVPRVMSKATGVSPVIVLLALLVGARLAGIVGILLSVPIVIIGQTILDSLLQERIRQDSEIA